METTLPTLTQNVRGGWLDRGSVWTYRIIFMIGSLTLSSAGPAPGPTGSVKMTSSRLCPPTLLTTVLRKRIYWEQFSTLPHLEPQESLRTFLTLIYTIVLVEVRNRFLYGQIYLINIKDSWHKPLLRFKDTWDQTHAAATVPIYYVYQNIILLLGALRPFSV